MDYMIAWGSMPVIFLLEKIFPARQSPWLGKGWASDLYHAYEPWLRGAFFGWYISFIEKSIDISFLKTEVRQLSLWWQFLLLLVSTELVFYFMHRLSHKLPWLWEFHKVHHSSTQYYSLMTKRFHILDLALFGFPTLATIAAIGADPVAAYSLVLFRSFMDVYGHSNINSPRVAPFFLVTPHFHAWHHSRHVEAIDKNFGRDMVLFDYIFCTAYYPKNKIPTEFGYPEYPNNYLVQQIMPFYVFCKKLLGMKACRQ